MADYIRDAAAIIGLAVFSYGFWLVWNPLGFIAAGGLLLAGAYFSARGDA